MSFTCRSSKQRWRPFLNEGHLDTVILGCCLISVPELPVQPFCHPAALLALSLPAGVKQCLNPSVQKSVQVTLQSSVVMFGPLLGEKFEICYRRCIRFCILYILNESNQHFKILYKVVCGAGRAFNSFWNYYFFSTLHLTF